MLLEEMNLVLRGELRLTKNKRVRNGRIHFVKRARVYIFRDDAAKHRHMLEKIAGKTVRVIVKLDNKCIDCNAYVEPLRRTYRLWLSKASPFSKPGQVLVEILV